MLILRQTKWHHLMGINNREVSVSRPGFQEAHETRGGGQKLKPQSIGEGEFMTMHMLETEEGEGDLQGHGEPPSKQGGFVTLDRCLC